MDDGHHGEQNLNYKDDHSTQHNTNSISSHRGADHTSGRHGNEEDLTGAFQHTGSGTRRMQNVTGSRTNLSPGDQNLTGAISNLSHGIQNLTGSRSFTESRLPRNAESLSRPRSCRGSLFGEENLLQEEQFPTNMPYRFDSPGPPLQPHPQYMSSPREGAYQDTGAPVPPFRNYRDTGDNFPTTRHNPVKGSDNTGKADGKKQEKEKKSITTKTFAHGMMDISLLTSNSTQLRAVLSNPDHEFYTLLLWLIGLSIVLQMLSAVLLILSDYFKTQVKEKDLQNQKKRKLLSFLSLALVTVVTSLNVLISAFSTPSPGYTQQVYNQRLQNDVPTFSSIHIPLGTNHTEL